MIELPFGSGVTAALVFVAFELVVIPIVMDSTTLAASFVSERRAKKDEAIHVKTLRYALWNEGLLSTQWSHVVLFVFRIACIIIPVYLETRLIYEEEAVMVSRQLRNAFVIPSRFNPEPSHLFKANLAAYRRAFAMCSHIDEDEWLVASTANVSFVGGEDTELDKANCIKSSERALLRVTAAEGIREREVTVDLSQGRYTYGVFDSGVNVRVNVSMGDEKDVQCFTPIRSSWNTKEEDWNEQNWTDVWLTCQRQKGRIIDLFDAFISVYSEDVSENQSEPDIQFEPERLRSSLLRGVRVEFHDDVLFDAEVVASAGLWLPPIGNTPGMYEHFGRHSYSLAHNLSVSVPSGAVAQRTVLDAVVVVSGAIYLGVILTFAVCMRVVAACGTTRGVHAVNTVDGLSANWASVARGTVGKDGVRLRLGRRQVADGWKETYEVVKETEMSCG